MPARSARGVPTTPDGRYIVVRGRLWRKSNPSLTEQARAELVSQLIEARAAIGIFKRAKDFGAVAAARLRVDAAKRALGERGPVWWTDGAPDFNRHLAKNSPYADWFGQVGDIAR